MKGNKKLLIVAVLLLLITVSFTTYAIYKSSASGDATIGTAAWVVEVNDTDIVANNTFTIDDVDWTGVHVSQVEGKIAPGDTGTLDIVIDATGSEVDVYYEVIIGTLTADGEPLPAAQTQLTATVHGGATSGTISYDENNMSETVTLDVVWNAVDSDEQNPIDVATADKELTIPVTVVVRQNPAS